MQRLLSRGALAAVLQSLLQAEYKAGRSGACGRLGDGLAAAWPESLPMLVEGGACLGLDSLEALRLSAAANEMFHLYESGRERELLEARTWRDWLDIIEANWRAGVTRITFLSSGSTGTPHRCTHEASSLAVEVGYLARVFVDRRRIVSEVPAHHVFGFLFTAMLADGLGVEVVRAGAGGSPREGDLVVAVPEQWEWLHRSIARWPAGVEGVTSTAACPRGLIAELMERGLGGMTEVYGSSETAGVATRRWPEEAYHCMPHWGLAEDAEGCIVHASGVRAELMDRIARRGVNGFVLEGRRDRAVQVGGTNVYPERIAEMLRRLPGVKDVSVRMMRAEEGARLKAFVVPEAGRRGEDLRQEMERWVRGRLMTAEQPRSWAFGVALPVNEMGKPADW